MFENVTVESIKQNILGRLTTTLQTREGSFTNDVISAMAAEICACYHKMDEFLPAFYVDENSGEFIDKQASIVGVIRKAGTYSTCEITFTGTDGATVPAGAPFYTAAGLTFMLSEAVTVSEGAAVGILTAAEVGDIYNIGEGEIVSTLKNYSGIASYTNAAAAGGSDQESDEALLARYLERMQRSATSGNPYHYQLWAGQVSGIGAARVISKWNGAGTVKVVLASDDMEPPDESIVTACAEYIETQRPVGPEVTVVAAQAQEISVAATVTVDGTTTKDAVQAALEASVRDYLMDLSSGAFSDNIDLQTDTLSGKAYTALYNQIAFRLLSVPGVVDYSALTVNGGTTNISVAADSLPVLTGVTVS